MQPTFETKSQSSANFRLSEEKMLCGSPLARSVDSSDFTLDDDGLDDGDVLP